MILVVIGPPTSKRRHIVEQASESRAPCVMGESA
ncbi:hypothetical protein L917_16986 [Phytophthora nicotianae]|uniref:Uncharacterized protein n=1 Tax=Phytophthora nicotianae TaxID=4792 RepID=W2KEE6_PHYNI|nr:hypothetical protein L917_16986 [Phytophthora nicotianae]